jgi:RHH-type proline utilization regulon transcriptional repressor/proline dehydrogenase/delta 1-pyrroline-5-carboxylate dehydrogenase
VRDAVAAARAAVRDWAALGAEVRAGYLLDLAKVVRARAEELQGVARPADVRACAALAQRLGSEGPGWLAGHSGRAGVAAGLSGAEAPLAMSACAALGALLAGHTCVLAPAPGAEAAALALRRALEEAQLPRGVLRLAPRGGPARAALLAARVDLAVVAGAPRLAAQARRARLPCVAWPWRECASEDPRAPRAALRGVAVALG